MKVINPKLLAEFRGIRVCEMCRMVKDCVPHHISARGAGGGKQLDCRINIASACFHCHAKTHNEPMIAEWECIVAGREREDAFDIEAVKSLLRRLPKRPRQDQIDAGRDELTLSAQRLFASVWREIPQECK